MTAVYYMWNNILFMHANFRECKNVETKFEFTSSVLGILILQIYRIWGVIFFVYVKSVTREMRN